MPSFHEDYIRTKRRDEALQKLRDAKQRRRHQAERRRFTMPDAYEPTTQLTRARHNGQLQQRLWQYYGWAPVE